MKKYMFKGFDNNPQNMNPDNRDPLSKNNPIVSRTAASPFLTIDGTGKKVINWYQGESVKVNLKLTGKMLFPESDLEYIEIEDFLKDKLIEIKIQDFENESIWAKTYVNIENGIVPFTLKPSESKKLRKGKYKLELRVLSQDAYINIFNGKWSQGYIDGSGNLINNDMYPNAITTDYLYIANSLRYNIIGTIKVPTWSKYGQGSSTTFLGQEDLLEYFSIDESKMRITFKQGLTESELNLFQVQTPLLEADEESFDNSINKVLVSNYNMGINIL